MCQKMRVCKKQKVIKNEKKVAGSSESMRKCVKSWECRDLANKSIWKCAEAHNSIPKYEKVCQEMPRYMIGH